MQGAIIKNSISFLKKLVLAVLACLLLGFLILTGLVIYGFGQLGPREDSELIRIFSNKLEIEEILEKKADIIDGSCLVFVIRIRQASADTILEQGLKYFDDIKSFPSKNGHLLDKWQRTPTKKKYDLKSNEFLDNGNTTRVGDFYSAIQCSKIDRSYQEMANKSFENEGSYYAVAPSIREIILVNPSEKIMFAVHDD